MFLLERGIIMDGQNRPQNQPVQKPQMEMKYCKYCGELIPVKAVICKHCGCQVEEIKKTEQPQVVINNTNTNTNTVKGSKGVKECNKWVALLLCIFLGFFGAHKFYERKFLLGFVYIITGGLVGIGWILDTIALLFKPNPYYV